MDYRGIISLLALTAATSAQAQYSSGMADNDAIDAPVPGFIGPEGDGIVPEDEDAINYLNPIFLTWADTVVDYSPAPGVDNYFSYPVYATGAVTGDEVNEVVSLGDLSATRIANNESPGSLTLSFADPIMNLNGSDFVIFENGYIATHNQGGAGIGGVWAELAYVEVSSDGENFARFDSVSLTESATGPYGTVDVTGVYNLVGKHVNAGGDSWGTPFDLSQLAGHPLVLSGDLDLSNVRYIRMVDIPGNGSYLDSLGNPIFDGWLTYGSGGADIEAVGAVSQHLTYAVWDSGRSLAPTGNDDGDPWNNLFEYAFGSDPLVNEPDAVHWELVDGQLALSFLRDERALDVVLYVEATADLEEWDVVATIPTAATATYAAEVENVQIASRHDQASLGVLLEYRLLFMLSELPRFYRLRAETVVVE